MIPPMPARRFAHLVLRTAFLPCLLSSGCGDSGPAPTIHPTSGKVVLANGKPLGEGTIHFEPVNAPGLSAKGQIQADGTFVLTTRQEGDGAAEGENIVFIEPAGTVGSSAKLPFPSQFTDSESSSIRVTIKPGKNQLEPISLKPKTQ